MSKPFSINTTAFDLGIEESILAEYFGFWAVKTDLFANLASNVGRINLLDHIATNKATYRALGPESQNRSESDTPYVLQGGVAQIRITGVMMKYASSLSSNASTVRIRREIKHAAGNPDVSTIFIRIDTPGGSVSGTKDLADEIIRAREKKPVIAFVDDLCASAGYWVASQCDEIIVNNTTALIGSIGTYSVVYDYSKHAEDNGVKVHVIGAGKFKGSGTPGTNITEEQLSEWQRITDTLNAEFKSAVAIGRSFASATMDEYADGRVHPANVALDMKLIDSIKTFDEAISKYHSNPRSTVVMPNSNSDTQTQPAVATMEQLEGICADSDFVLKQLKAKATVVAATAAYNEQLKAENETLKESRAADIKKAETEAAEKAQVEADAAAAAAQGTSPLGKESDATDGAGDNFGGDPIAAFNMAVSDQMKKQSKPDRFAATKVVAKRNPELHQAYLTATNPSVINQRMLAEKYNVAS